MKTVLMQIVIISTVVMAMMLAFKAVSTSSMFSAQKSSTFECGFDLLTNLRLPFSINFFIISIIFLIFDVELILLLPFAFFIKTTQSITVYVVMVLFFIILMAGFLYEWWMGLLNWMM